VTSDLALLPDNPAGGGWREKRMCLGPSLLTIARRPQLFRADAARGLR
jgi:hypothetical protein